MDSVYQTIKTILTSNTLPTYDEFFDLLNQASDCLERETLKATAKMLAAYAEMNREKRKELHEILSMFKDVIADDIPIFKPLVLLKKDLRIIG